MTGSNLIPFNDQTALREIVFPLAIADRCDGGIEYKKHIGSGFFFGHEGFALTASHVLDQLEIDNNPSSAHAMFVHSDNRWLGLQIESYERHPEQDVAIIKIKNRYQKSWLALTDYEVPAGFDYICHGYPIVVTEELKHSRLTADEVYERPDLVVTKGYVRRRVSREIPFSVFKGNSFLELSTISGDGCSGGPIVQGNRNVVGIYVGSGPTVGYGVRLTALRGWTPKLLGKPIF